MKKINDIYKELNNPNSDLEPFEYEMDIKIGEIVAAEFPSGSRQTEYYRAKVISIQPKTETKQTNFEVNFSILQVEHFNNDLKLFHSGSIY